MSDAWIKAATDDDDDDAFALTNAGRLEVREGWSPESLAYVWTDLTDEDKHTLAAALLGWPVDQVTRVDPATHVVVERDAAEDVIARLRLNGMPRYAARFRAALGEGGAR